jgi:DNA-directed RNA polymerase specialized sigma24 family protein
VFELNAASTPGDLLENRDARGLKNLEGQTMARSELADLREALLRLNPSRASAVFLHDVLGHELAEIAVMEGVTVAAAQSRLVRGRSDLYALLGRESKSKVHGGEA